MFFSIAVGSGYSFKNNLQGIVFTESVSVSAGSCHRQGEAEDEKDHCARFQHFLLVSLFSIQGERGEWTAVQSCRLYLWAQSSLRALGCHHHIVNSWPALSSDSSRTLGCAVWYNVHRNVQHFITEQYYCKINIFFVAYTSLPHFYWYITIYITISIQEIECDHPYYKAWPTQSLGKKIRTQDLGLQKCI